MPKQVLTLEPGQRPRGMSQGTRAGDFLFISGQIGRDATGKTSPSFEVQARQVFKNMEAVLATAGAKLSDVTKITCFVTNFDNLPIYRKVREEVFPSDPPASSTVVVASLAGREYLIEVEAIAALKG